jgi:hypothetical protein
MRRLLHRWTGAAATLGFCALAGCVGGGFAPPPIDAGALSVEEAERAASLISDRVALSARMRNIEHALITAAAPFCANIAAPNLGVILATEKTFTGEIARTAAREKVGLGDGVTILHVVPGSGTDLAGVKAGDTVLTAGGKAVKAPEDVLGSLKANREQVKLKLRRGSEEIERVVEPDLACPVTLVYVASAQLLPATSAEARGQAFVPRGLVRFFERDDDLAVVIGHQIAELLFSRSESEIERERRFDRLGLYLTARAGYDVSNAVEVWERIVGEYPWLATPRPEQQYRNYPHLGVALRLDTIRKTVAEIQALKERNADIVPPPN